MSEIGIIEIASKVDAWRVRVRVSDHGSSRDFEVVVTQAEMASFAPGELDPADLVRRSFAFLLAREPKESILGSFGLSTIVRYFPEYETEIRR
jgi:hypothetical protein